MLDRNDSSKHASTNNCTRRCCDTTAQTGCIAACLVRAVGVALVGSLVMLEGCLPRVPAAQHLHKVLRRGETLSTGKTLYCRARTPPTAAIDLIT